MSENQVQVNFFLVAAKTGKKKKKKALQQPTGTRGARCANNC
jgi:hypothetical protein